MGVKELGFLIIVLGVASFVLPFFGLQLRVLLVVEALGVIGASIAKLAVIGIGFWVYRIGADLE